MDKDAFHKAVMRLRECIIKEWKTSAHQELDVLVQIVTTTNNENNGRR